MWRLVRPLLVIGLIFIIVGLYWYGAVEQLTHVNTDMSSTDQSAYMDYARTLYESNYTFIGDRNRMPVYPFLQSLLYRPGMPDAVFFVRGKYFNLLLSLGLLAGLALILRQFFRSLHTLDVILIVAFTVFVFKAGWFQAELLFYFVSFCLFLLMWRLLQRPSWKLAILTGFIAGLAHLTKASILPGLVIFLVLAGVKWVWVGYRSRRFAGDATRGQSALPHLVMILLVGGVFLATVLPYITTSKRVFGRYFYNVNSTFYMWYDSWEEAKQGTRAHGDRVGWPDMPAEQIPNMSKYLREHTLHQIIERFVDGGRQVLRNVVGSYGYFKYIVIYSCLLGVAIICSWRQVRQIVTSNPILCLFIVTYFVTFLMLYFWYARIVAGNRLVLAQFLPLMFTLSSGLHKLLLPFHVKVGKRSVSALEITDLIVLAVVIVDIYFVLMERVGTMYGGR